MANDRQSSKSLFWAGIFGKFPVPELETGSYLLSRNLAIVTAGFVFLIRGQWQPLAVLTTAAMALPVFDATVLYNVLGGATPLAVHVSTFLVISLASVLLWLRVRNTSG